MASVTIKTDFTDGETLLIQVCGKSSYPDALDQMKAAALDAYEQALHTRLTAQGTDTE